MAYCKGTKMGKWLTIFAVAALVGCAGVDNASEGSIEITIRSVASQGLGMNENAQQMATDHCSRYGKIARFEKSTNLDSAGGSIWTNLYSCVAAQ